MASMRDMSNKVQLLIDILLDPTAREDEKDDAAMDLGDYDDDKALDVLLRVVSDSEGQGIVAASCGESIARILVRKNEFRSDILKSLRGVAKTEADGYIRVEKPDWPVDSI
jgi:hypothetical protein